MTYAQVIMVSSYSTVMDNAFKKFMDNKLKPAFGDGCVQPFIIPHPRITEYNDQDELNFGISEERFHMECSCNLAEARRHAYNRRRREMNATYQTGSLTAQ